MYAIIASGGKQYRVAQGDTVTLEKLTTEEGQAVDFNEILMISDDTGITVGKPLVEGACVKATVVKHFRDKKVKILKFKRRKHHMKRMGHRQHLTKVVIEEIKKA